MPFIMLKKFPFVPSFLSVFIMKGCWIFQMLFLSIEMIMCCFFFPLRSVNVVYYIHWFSYVKLPVTSWHKSPLVVVLILLMLLNLVCYSFVEILCISIQKVYWSIISFSFGVFSCWLLITAPGSLPFWACIWVQHTWNSTQTLFGPELKSLGES